jgi:hypothetical protein
MPRVTVHTGYQRFTPGAVTVDIGRGNKFAAITGAVVFALLVAAAMYAAVTAEEITVLVVGIFFAVLFAIPTVILIVNYRFLTQPRGLVFDARGVHAWHGSHWTAIPWQEIAAVGIGYEEPPKKPEVHLSVQDAIGAKLGDAVKGALKVDDKRAIAVEIFPVYAQTLARYPALARYRREEVPPAPGLVTSRWRLPLPPAPGLTKPVEQGVRTFGPQRWLGWFERPGKKRGR